MDGEASTWLPALTAAAGAGAGFAISAWLRPGRTVAPAEAAARDDAPAAADQVDVEALGEPLIVVGPASRVAAANAAARRLLGEEIVGENLRLILRHPAALDAAREAQAGIEVEREIAGLGRGDGLYRLRAAADRRGRLLLTFTDISQVRMAERMRADFVANASHELRTPLATIRGFVETLQGPAADDAPARARFLDIMARESARMTRLIDDLLSLSRIELDKYVRPQTPLDLAPLITDVARTLAMRLEADRRVLEIETPALPPVTGDRDQILQVLHNLVSNALKYGRTATPIRLAATVVDDGAMVRIAVSDDGDGIAPEHLPRLTERFYRVDNSRSRELGGTGLGLAIVKHIVERHRGRLSVDSKLGEGTTVAFTLPVAG